MEMAELELDKEGVQWKRNGISGMNGGEHPGTSSLGTVSDTAILEAMKSDSDGPEDEWMRNPSVEWRQHGCPREKERCMAILTIFTLVFLIVVAITIGVVCSKDHSTSCMSYECIKTSASILGAMNQSVDPCVDFYQYSCGQWLENVDLPDGMSRWGSFGEVDMSNKHVLKKLLAGDDSTYKGTSSKTIRKALDYYAACMNKTQIEDIGIQPLLKFIEQIGGWSVLADDIKLGQWTESQWDITDALISVQYYASPFFTMWVSPDDKDSNSYIIQMQQSGLGLGARELYLDNETDIEDAYVTMGADIANYLSVEGDDKSQQQQTDIFDAAMERMRRIIALELKLAKIFIPKEELQDPVATYHKMDLKELADKIPQINMMKYMSEVFGEDIPETEQIIVYTPTYFPKLNDIIKETPARDMADYIQWLAIQPVLKELNQPIMNFVLKFRKVMDGIDTLTPRWQTCVDRTQDALGHATGALFVEKKVTDTIKTETQTMIHHVRQAFLDNLKTLDWMDKTTRQQAKDKANAVIEMIGYPEWIKDSNKLDEYYKKITVKRNDSFGNVLNVAKFYTEKNLRKRGQPVDKKEWGMSAGEVNAYYSPSFNQIVFPSGILQYPFYDPNAPIAINYGAAGMVMGHELTHGFDNSGRKYDKFGNLHDWWLNETAQAYEKKAQCMVDQYSKFKLGDININGKLTLGENIADNSGMHIAMEAFRLRKHEKPKDDIRLPGIYLTADQLFFLGFARVWCTYATPEALKMSVYSDVHSNAKYRIIGVVSNSDEFAKAFHCPKGSPMNPKEKCRLW